MTQELLAAYRYLKQLEEHHVQLNACAGRRESDSKTLRLVRAAMQEISALIPSR